MFEFFMDLVGVCFVIMLFYIWNNVFKDVVDLIDLFVFIIVEVDFFVIGIIEEYLLDMWCEVFLWGVFVEFVMFGECFNCLQEIG